ncbi:hypothetical protein A2363_03150 [Candidatus Gottesmanbacteria bacterium RIFOXYB1_FULL_47_11]|uniref:Uncharacterized protein n=1 Tax=Candidatus Gottesmanbacteria bacterium RIFOXYB1_FULL_47_11 TaxID=1798401 RepID=A0A1F6BFL6_9BACT|nr:MAG: hypothetical protein A2363_03150 [Candidatus Gottesmanbacteria bacterium RIFOXYB1_FULL_47_11]
MGLVVQLLLTVAVLGVTLSGGSLVWPRITSAPRPQLLQDVHDKVIQTAPGQQAAQVLGVADEQTVEPINISDIASNAVNSVKAAAEKRAQTIIMAQISAQLTNQYEKLPEDQQLELQQIICPPPATPPAVVK